MWTQLSGDLIGILRSTEFLLPPHQPLAMCFNMEVMQDWSGTFAPYIGLAVPGKRHTISGRVVNLPDTTKEP